MALAAVDGALASGGELQIAAAADLARVEAPLAAAFTKKTGVTIRWITGSSGVLAQQAQNGAPFDVFLSASDTYVRELIAKNAAIGDTLTIYATGRVGLWSPSGRLPIRDLKDLLGASVKHVAIANPAHAPYGAAAKQALESQGLWRGIEPKIVYAENVRQALQFGESGNVEAVLTAWALVNGKPGAVVVPASMHKPIRQAGAVLSSSHEVRAGREFLQFLRGPEARAILLAAGFSDPD